MDLPSLNRRINIKNPTENKASTLEIPVIYKRLSQMSCSHDDQIMFFIQPKYSADLVIEIFHIVSIPLLSEAAEVIQILPDLRRSNLHDITQFLRGNSLDPFIFQFTQIPEISG